MLSVQCSTKRKADVVLGLDSCILWLDCITFMWHEALIVCLFVCFFRWWEIVPWQRGRGPVWTTLLWGGHHGLWDHVSTWFLPGWWRWTSCILSSEHCRLSPCTVCDDPSPFFCVWVCSDDTDDWDFEVFSKPSEVQNDLYANNEDEEDGEDLDGRKVMVRWCQSLGL